MSVESRRAHNRIASRIRRRREREGRYDVQEGYGFNHPDFQQPPTSEEEDCKIKTEAWDDELDGSCVTHEDKIDKGCGEESLGLPETEGPVRIILKPEWV